MAYIDAKRSSVIGMLPVTLATAGLSRR